MGIKERDGVATCEELVRKRFKCYFELELIMCDRSNINPAANSDELFQNSDDDLLSISSSDEIKSSEETKVDEPTLDAFDEQEDDASNVLDL